MEAAAIAGVIYAVLAIAALTLLSRYPDLTQPNEELTAWFDEGDNQTTLILGLNLAAVSSIAFLWFVAVIRRRLGEREDRFFSTVFFGSAILYAGVWLVAACLLAAPAVALSARETARIGSESAALGFGVAAALLLVAAPRLQAVFVFATSTLILRTGTLPKWLALLGYLTGVVLFTVPLISEPLGIGFPMWVFIVSVTILVARSTNRDSGKNSEGTRG